MAHAGQGVALTCLDLSFYKGPTGAHRIFQAGYPPLVDPLIDRVAICLPSIHTQRLVSLRHDHPRTRLPIITIA